ncbi:MAG: 4-alpha-glucanotransferase [Faecousia sp.]
MRSSGILMHITSLPGKYGVGTMGEQAYKFVDFLKKAGQSAWQILPLTPTGFGDSPYQSCSTFAGNHYLIDLPTLVKEGLLTEKDLEGIQWNITEDKVDFGLLYLSRLKVLRCAYARFTPDEAYEAFCTENSSWLPDFTLFMALKNKFGGKPWYEWEEKLKFRDPDSIWAARGELKEEIGFFSFVQYLFFRQWTALHDYAKKNGICIIGDVPIYVPRDSVEVWSSPELFQMDEKLDPKAVAGCPPDAFSADGQLWGNPLYRWDVLAADGYSWWIRRLAAAGKLYDVVRMDHFRAFAGYWSVPFGDKTARGGRWITGPGMEFIHAVKKALPELRLIAEDLGYLTQDVLDLRDESGYPGMKVLQFAFDSREPSDYLPHTYTANSVCYTGTHDNMTTRQWLETGTPEMQTYATEYMRLSKEEGLVWGVIRTAMSSVADTCVIPLQDYLDLGSDARMNFPGTTNSNWTWRAKDGMITDTLAEKIHHLTTLYARLGSQEPEEPDAEAADIEDTSL